MPDQALDDLRDLLIDAETLVGAYTAGYSEESMESLRARLKATQGRITEGYAKAREQVASGSKRAEDTEHLRSCEVLALASGIGTLVGALVDRHKA